MEYTSETPIKRKFIFRLKTDNQDYISEFNRHIETWADGEKICAFFGCDKDSLTIIFADHQETIFFD